MALGDQETYGTVLRVTPLTDGTRDSIHMTNPGTTAEAGVMTGACVCRAGVSNSVVGECVASTLRREASSDAARQWPCYPRANRWC
jgi:hypothetical protein